MQLIVILGVIAKLALVSGECDVGKTVNDFDFTKVSIDVTGITALSSKYQTLCYSVHNGECFYTNSVDGATQSKKISWAINT